MALPENRACLHPHAPGGHASRLAPVKFVLVSCQLANGMEVVLTFLDVLFLAIFRFILENCLALVERLQRLLAMIPLFLRCFAAPLRKHAHVRFFSPFLHPLVILLLLVRTFSYARAVESYEVVSDLLTLFSQILFRALVFLLFFHHALCEADFAVNKLLLAAFLRLDEPLYFKFLSVHFGAQPPFVVGTSLPENARLRSRQKSLVLIPAHGHVHCLPFSAACAPWRDKLLVLWHSR